MILGSKLSMTGMANKSYSRGGLDFGSGCCHRQNNDPVSCDKTFLYSLFRSLLFSQVKSFEGPCCKCGVLQEGTKQDL